MTIALSRDATVYVAGHGGLVGSAIVRHLREQGFTSVVGARSSEIDLRDRAATRSFFERERPAVVIDAAARVGGILANSTRPVDFLSDNLRMQLNLIDTAHEFDVEHGCCFWAPAASTPSWLLSRSPSRA